MTSTVLELASSKDQHPFQMRPAALNLANTPLPPPTDTDDTNKPAGGTNSTTSGAWTSTASSISPHIYPSSESTALVAV